MIWPGMGDPVKRKKTIRFLLITAAIGLVAYLAAFMVQGQIVQGDPLKVCIDNRDTPYKISATVELIIDGNKAEIPANIGRNEGCTHALYTLSNDGTIYAESEEEYPFEIGHFFWTWTTYHEQGFPFRDMNQDKSRILMDGKESLDFIGTPLIDGSHYRAEFTTKAYDEAKEKDFLPPEP